MTSPPHSSSQFSDTSVDAQRPTDAPASAHAYTQLDKDDQIVPYTKRRIAVIRSMYRT